MGSSFDPLRGVDPIYPKWTHETEREREERRGRDARGREWKEREEDETHLRETFQEKAPPILPSTPERKIRAIERGKPHEEGGGRWVREQLGRLSIRDKVGQLLFLVVEGQTDPDLLAALVEEFHVGGLLFSSLGGPLESHLALVDRLQSLSPIPLLIGVSWGDGSHFEGMVRLPLPSTLGRISDPELLKRAGSMVGDYFGRLGFHAVVLGLAESDSALIEEVGADAFLSDDRKEALERAIGLMGGLRESGLLPIPQTFMAGESSEEGAEGDWLIGQLLQPLSRLGYEQIRPFRRMAQAGVESALFPHMYLPILVGGRPAEGVHPDLGLIFGHLMVGEGEWRDRLMMGREGTLEMSDLLLAAVGDGAISRSELDQRVGGLLALKERVGLGGKEPSRSSNVEELNRESLDGIHRTLYSYALSLRVNEEGSLPLPEHVGLIEVDPDGDTYFRQLLEGRLQLRSITTTPFHLESRAVEEGIVEQMEEYHWIVVAIYKERSLSPQLFELLHRLRALNKKVILVAFLPFRVMKGVGRESAYLVANEAEPAAQIAAAERLFS